jgi:hypothetical protein
MAKRKKDKQQSTKLTHLKLNIEQHESHQQTGMNSGAPEG